MGAVVTSSGSPFPTLIDGAVLAHLTLSIAGGEQGSFDIVLDGIDGLGEFGIFDGDPNGYPNVLVQGATIQVIPEPSALFCFAGISSLMGFRNITRRFLRK